MDYLSVAKMATSGSPVLLQAVGRIYGLGEEERDALLEFGIPAWTWLAIGVCVGAVAGIRAYKQWPDSVPGIVQGE